MADKPINVEKTKEETLLPTGQSQIQVNPGNVPIVTIQLLNDINIKLGKILSILEKKIG